MTLDEYTAAARPLNPDYTDAQIAEQYHTEFPPSASDVKAMPTLDEYTKAAKPLNPDYSDDDIKAQWQSEFGSAGARPDKPGFLESFGQGAKQGAYELGVSGAETVKRLQDVESTNPLRSMASDAANQLSKTAEQYHPGRDLSQEPWYKRLSDPEQLGNLLGNVAVQSLPALAGAAVGGLAGGPAGAAAGMTAVTYFQQAGSTYREALARYQKDGLSETEAHEKAYTDSGIAGLVSGAVNALTIPATLAAPFTGVLKNLATKYILNVGVDTADQATQNIVEKSTFKPEQELTSGIPEAIVGSAALGAPETIVAIKSTVKIPEETPHPIDKTAEILSAPNLDTAIQKAAASVDASPISTEDLDAFIGKEKEAGQLTADSTIIEQELKADRDELVDVLKLSSSEIEGESPITTDEVGNVFFQGSPIDIVHPTELPATTGPEEGMSQEKHEVLNDIAGLFGKRLVVYKSQEFLPEGVVKVGGDTPASTIFLSDKTNAADLFSTFTHEALHLMEGTEFHSALGMAVWENLTPDAKQLAIDRHGDLDHDGLMAEMVSDIGGTELNKPEVWQKVYANLQEKVGDEQAKTEMLSFIDQIKALIEKVKTLIASKPWATGFGKSKKTLAEQYVTDLTKMHDALASGVADAIYQRKGSGPGAGKIALSRKSPKASRAIVHPDAVKAFTELSTKQPRESAFAVQKAAGAGVLSPVAENVSGMLRTMTEKSGEGSAQTPILSMQIDRSLAALAKTKKFEETHQGNLRNNARAAKTPVADIRTGLDKAMAAYADAHRDLPVYNEAQHLAREASVAVGEKRFKDAAVHLKALKKIVSSPDADNVVLGYTKDGYVKPEKLTPDKKKVYKKSEKVDSGRQPESKPESKSKEEFDYASTQINLPAPLAKRVLEIGKQIEAGDLTEKGLEDKPHITIKYGLHSEDPKAVASVVSSSRGVSAKIGDIGMFVTDEADVVILKVESPDLVKLNETISTLPNTTEFEYTPHITIAYVKTGKGKGYVRTLENPLEGQSISVDEIQFSNKKGEFTPIKLKEESGPAVVNIRLNVNDGSTITAEQAIAELTKQGVKVTDTETRQSDSEPTLIATLDRALTPEEANAVSANLKQDAIAQKVGDTGEIYGPAAEKWKPFNEKFFLAPDKERVRFSKKNPLIGMSKAELPVDAKSPLVKWDKDALRANAEMIKESWSGVKSWGKGQPTVYQSYVPIDEVPHARTPEIEGVYDWSEYKKSGVFPPITIVIHQNGVARKLEDGNHRAKFWTEKGFTHFPAWIVDFRKVQAPTTRFSKKIWFSAMGNMLNEKMPANASVEQVRNLLKGAKEDEVKWTGINDYLDAQKGPVNKHNLLKWLETNDVEIEEVLKGTEDRQKELDRLEEAYRPDLDKLFQAWKPLQDEYKAATKSKKIEEIGRVASRIQQDITSMRELREHYVNFDGFEDEHMNTMLRNDLYSLAQSGRTKYVDLQSFEEEAGRPFVTRAELLSLREGYDRWNKETVDRYGSKEFEDLRRRHDAAEQAYRTLGYEYDAERDKIKEQVGTQFADRNLRLPGGEEYHELLLTLPHKENFELDDFLFEMDKKYGTKTEGNVSTPAWEEYQLTPDEQKTFKRLQNEQADRKTDRNSRVFYGHFQEQNVVAHVRFDTRKAGTGESVLFLEEVQSDWHEQGRERGYTGGEKDTERAQVQKEINEVLKKNGWYGEIERDHWSLSWLENHGVSSELADRWFDTHMRGNAGEPVPDAPFSKTWPELVMKRMLRWAAEHNYDRIAWTTGAQQNERYGLSSHVDRLTASDQNGIPSMGMFKLDAFKNGTFLRSITTNSPEELRATIGRELAEKLLTSKPTSMTGGRGLITLQGLDLEVGGSGMKYFYDQMLPRFMEKYLKRFGTKVDALQIETVVGSEAQRRDYARTANEKELDVLNNGVTVHSIALTPEMKDSVINKGQPRFAPRQRVQPTYPVSQPGKLDKFIRLLQDKNIDIKRVVEAIQATGATVPEQLNPVLAEEMYQKRDEQRAKDFTNDELRPLVDLMRLNKVTIKQLDEYLHARHVIDDNLNARLQAINPDLSSSPNFDKLAGITDAQARAIIAAANRPVMDVLTQHVDDMVETTRELMIHYGLEKQSTIDAWRQQYKRYVPLHREGFDDEGHPTGAGRSVRGSTVKERGGSGLAVENILANIAQARDQIVTRGEKQRPVIAFAGLQMLHPNPAIATLDKPATISYTDPLTGLTMTVPGNLANYEVPTIRRFNPKTGKMQTYPDPTYKGRDNVVNFRIKGEDYAIVFNEQNERAMEVAKAFKNLATPQLNGIMKVVAPYTRYLAAINTQYNPIFGVVNFVRDTQFAMLTLSSTPLAGKQATILKNAVFSLNGIYQDARAVRKGLNYTSATADLWRRFEHVGGPTGYRDLFFTASERAEEIQRMMNPKSWRGITSPEKLGRRMEETALFKWLSDYNLMMENSIRLGVFKTAVDNGMSDLKAASLAKNITVNFNKKGQIGAQMGSLYAFFNANVQGTARIAETLFERTPSGFKISALGKKIIVGGILMGVLQTFALALGGFDDDDPPEFVKQKNLVIPVPGTEKGYAMIPMPLGFNLLPNVGRLVSEAMMDVVKGKPAHVFEKGAALFNTMYSTMSPTGGSGGLVQEVSPTALDPFVALTTNKDWTGKAIAKQDHSALDPSPGHARAHNTATAWAKALSHAINWATGGSDFVPGVLSPTPDQIDYLIEQATGGVGREVSKSAQVAQSLVTGENFPAHKIPLIGRFVGSGSGDGAIRSKFYENVLASNLAFREFKGRALDHKAFSDFVKTHPEARFAKAAATVQDDVAILNKQKAFLLKGGASKEVIRAQEERITSLMNRFNMLIEKAQEQAP